MNLYRKFVRWLAREELRRLEREWDELLKQRNSYWQQYVEAKNRELNELVAEHNAMVAEARQTWEYQEASIRQAQQQGEVWRHRHDYLLNQIVNTTKLADTIPPLLLPPEEGNAD